MYLVIRVGIRETVGVRKPIGTLDLGVGMRTRILTGVLGILSLEIKIPTWTRNANGTPKTVETRLLIRKVTIGILDLVIRMKIPTGETMSITNLHGVLEMKTRIPAGVGGGNWRGGYRGRGGSDREGFRGRGFGVEENVMGLVAGESVVGLVVGETVETLVVEVDRTGKVLVVGGDQKEDVEPEAGEAMINLVVGTIEGALVRMGPLTGRSGQIMVDGRISMDLKLGTRLVVTRIGRAGGREMQMRSILAGTEEVEVIRAGVQQVELMIMDLRLGTREMQIRSIQPGNKQSWSSASGGNNNWNNNGSSQTAEASWKKSTTEETNIQGGGWNTGSSSNTTSKEWGQSSAADKAQTSSWKESADGRMKPII